MQLLPVMAAAVAVVVAVLGAVPQAAAQAAACECPQPKTQEKFDAEKYLGRWYEMKKVPRPFEEGGECGTAQYSWHNSSKLGVDVLNKNFVPKFGAVGSANLYAEPDDLPNGKLTVTIPGTPAPPSMYWVLGTDYESYAVVYSCSVVDGASIPHITLWVLSRSPSKYTEEVDATVLNIIKQAGLDASILRPVAHNDDCPVADCKDCSSTVADLDLAKLKGRWFEVQHSPFATGSDTQSCSVAEISVVEGGLQYNATTYDWSSKADKNMVMKAKWLDATKKEGAFTISDNLGSKMCVLGTDYDSWAVVSICLPQTATTSTTTPAAVPSVTTTVPVPSGGVFVMARRRGLTPEQQMKANEKVVNAGLLAAHMQATASTPCPAAALAVVPSAASAASAAAPAALLVVALAAGILGHFKPAQ